MTPNIERGDLITPIRGHLGIYLVESVGPTSDQLTCRSLSGGPLGELHTFFPAEVMWAWKPSYNRFREAELREAFEAAPTELGRRPAEHKAG